MDMGVDCFKTDFGERIPVRDIRWFDGSDPVYMHNYYTYLYNKVVFDVVKDRKGEGEAILFARSATVGGQQRCCSPPCPPQRRRTWKSGFPIWKRCAQVCP